MELNIEIPENKISVDNPLVSVVLVVRNGGKFLGEAICSVFIQDYESVEIIVVDGKSEDDSVSIANSFEGVRVIPQTHLGLADARNLGIDSARGELIAFLDSDDVWVSDKLSSQVKFLQEHSDIIGTITKFCFFFESGCAFDIGHDDRFVEVRIGYTPGALVVRKCVFQKIGYFDPAYSIGCDTDWFARVKDANLPLTIIPRVLLHKRIHEHNLSSSRGIYRNEIFQMLRESLYRKRVPHQ